MSEMGSARRNIGGLLFAVILLAMPALSAAQKTCEPQYSIPYLTINSTAAPEKTGSNEFDVMLTVGQPFNTTAANRSVNSVAMGYWSTYLTEPRAPIVRASDGDYQDKVYLQWTVEDDRTGPPVTGNQVTLYRNGQTLTTLPITQTDYQDFNVFAGEYYVYGVTSSNSMGASHTDDDIGFLNPNGVITGHVATPSGNPVLDTKVVLTPNLGRSAVFDGQSYIYFFDSRTSANRLFTGLEGNYTIETWFRSIHAQQQTILAAVDSATANAYVVLELTDEGRVRWRHSPTAGGNGAAITTVKNYVEDKQWHHLAVVFEDNDMMMYVDGFIVGHATAAAPVDDTVEIVVGKRSPIGSDLFFSGRLDDLRIWSEARPWAQIRKHNDLTRSGEEDHLAAYWKFDEVEGDIIFDLTANDNDGKVCGVTHDNITAPVYVGALTDSLGNYAIKGIYYAGGTTFTVTPQKTTSIGRALKFDGVDDYIGFQGQRVDLTAGYTVEGWFNTSGAGQQTLLAGVDPEDGSDRLRVELGAAGTVTVRHYDAAITSTGAYNNELWHHVAATYDTASNLLALYVDGVASGTATSTRSIPNLTEIVIARQAPEVSSNYFVGYLDEMRVWGEARSFEQIGGTRNQPLQGDEYGLVHYWRMNEGTGDLAADVTGNLVTGTIRGAVWSEDIPLNEVFIHTYEPESRQATLNRSTISVDRVEFTDISMIPVSGFVRYENTACFQKDVEILVNGKSFVPPRYTDSDGKFVVEFEPGAIHQRISASYGTHDFIPPFIELPMITTPITALYLNDKVKRKVTGKVVGGACEFPITPSQGQIEVHISSVNGCVERIVVPQASGSFSVEGLPPLIYQVSVDHPDPTIEAFFTADTLSLAEADQQISFVYRSAPKVTMAGFPQNPCDLRVMEMDKKYKLTVSVFEEYVSYSAGQRVVNTCPVESGALTIVDGIGKGNSSQVSFQHGAAEYTVTGGEPKILGGGAHPYQKNIQVTATDDLNRNATVEEWTYVTGRRTRETNFASSTPEIPLLILRDPPGDGSYSFLEKGTTTSQSISIATTIDKNEEGFIAAHLGPDIEIETGFIVSTSMNIDVTADFTTTLSSGIHQESAHEQTWSFTATDAFSTSDNEAFIGDGGDVYVGGALNLIYGVVDVLEIDNQCNVKVRPDLIIVPHGFATTYIYSENHILNDVIPALELLGDTVSAERWRSFVEKNRQLKSRAAFDRNISFDAGALFDYTETTETSETTTVDFEMFVSDEFATEFGVTVNGLGVTGGYKVNSQITMGKGVTTSKTHSNTVGFALRDDDAGDHFSVNIKKDPVYGTPVFQLVSGASSCPLESGTVPFDGPQLNVSPPQAVDVLPDAEAAFTLSIGNASQMDADREYSLRVLNESNPDGARVSINGVPLEGAMSFFVPAGQQVQAIMTVARNPAGSVYDYDGLQMELASPCDPGVADVVSVDAHFQVPCTEVHIADPEPGWLITSDDHSDTLWVTLDGYDRTDENLDHVELQYRRGQGDWSVATRVLKDQLIDSYVRIPWIISPSIVIDGEYQLRGRAVCTAGLAPGTSPTVAGVIDRTPPRLLGAAEPTDGILQPDDRIAVTFNEPVQCGAISVGAQHITLKNTVTGQAVDFTYTCGDNQIVINPSVQNRFLENQTLRASVGPVEDLHGNVQTTPIEWEFFVNQNPVEWSGLGVTNIVMYNDQEYSTTRTLANRGGSNRSYEITSVPSWLQVSPAGGTLTPGSSETISFRLRGAETGAGWYRQTVYASGTLGDEPMLVDIRVLCYPPVWGTVTPEDFQYTMTITANLWTDGSRSDDPYDVVGVFVNGQLRGVASVQYISKFANLANTHPYEVFLTVYSNVQSGEALSFRVWDASECRELGMVREPYSFVANAVHGTPTSPVTITSTSEIMSSLAFKPGWTWFSLNLKPSDLSSTAVLRPLKPASGDLVKSQTSFSQYVPNVGWLGTLATLGSKSMYLLKLSRPDTLRVIGYVVDVETDTIPVVKGWNWVGYTPQQSMGVDQALASLNAAATGDLIKSQFAYAQFVENLGWIGSLRFMNPKLGYLLNARNPGTLLYPWNTPAARVATSEDVVGGASASSDVSAAPSAPATPGGWQVDPLAFQHTMTITCAVGTGQTQADTTAGIVAAFVGDQCRGVAEPIHVPELRRTLTFLMVYSNLPQGETVRLRVLDQATGLARPVAEEVAFEANGMLGAVEAPFVLTLRPLAIGDPGFVPDRCILSAAFPNPFNSATRIGYGLPAAGDVRVVIYSLLGQKIRTLVSGREAAGYRSVVWDGRDDKGRTVSSGPYICSMEAGAFRDVKKLVILK